MKSVKRMSDTELRNALRNALRDFRWARTIKELRPAESLALRVRAEMDRRGLDHD